MVIITREACFSEVSGHPHQFARTGSSFPRRQIQRNPGRLCVPVRLSGVSRSERSMALKGRRNTGDRSDELHFPGLLLLFLLNGACEPGSGGLGVPRGGF